MLGAFLVMNFKGVAQLVEQRSPKPYVAGSIPVTFAKHSLPIGGLFYCLEIGVENEHYA